MPYNHSLRVAPAVRAPPGACQSLSAMCCESNAEMSHHLAMPREGGHPADHGAEFSVCQLRRDTAMFVALSL